MMAVTGAVGMLSAAVGLGAGFAAAADAVAVAALPLRAAHVCMALLTRAQLRVRGWPELSATNSVCCCRHGMIPRRGWVPEPHCRGRLSRLGNPKQPGVAAATGAACCCHHI
jgi:hypothetical protein